MTLTRIAGSFRDPAGYVFRRDGVLYRQVNPVFAERFDAVAASGLYEALWAAGLLVRHEVTNTALGDGNAHAVLRPEEVPFVSQPHEWPPAARRDAALATLEAQRIAIEHGCTMRDASAHNIVLHRGRAVLLDTLSFEPWTEGDPWIAYGQFCRHFLAPLALETIVDHRLRRLLVADVDGIPLDLASSLLPGRTKLRPGLLTHIHVHARASGRGEADPDAEKGRTVNFSERAMLGLVDQLRGLVAKMIWDDIATTWSDYDAQLDHYSESATAEKERLVAQTVAELAPSTVWDLGANTGRFSAIAAASGAHVVAWDIDAGAVEQAWRRVAESPPTTGEVLPLILDLANPSPGLGWGHNERPSLAERGPADVVLALALIHHLAIQNNVPLPDVLRELTRLGEHVIVEWVPKEDIKVRTLLATREDVFADYTREGFEAAAASHAEIVSATPLPDSGRVLYVLRRR